MLLCMQLAPNGTTHPRNTQYIIRIVGLHHRSGCDSNQVYHPRHYGVSDDHGDNALDSALFAQALALLRVNEIGMFWLEV